MAASPAIDLHRALTITNVLFMFERLKRNPTVLDLSELVMGAKFMEYEDLVEKGGDFELGPIHISHLYKALTWMSKAVRARVLSLKLWGTFIGDRDVGMLLEMIDLFPNLKELDLSYTLLRTPDLGDMRLLLAKLTRLQIEGTPFAKHNSQLLFHELAEEELHKIFFITSLEPLYPQTFRLLVPERLQQAVIERHKAYFAEVLIVLIFSSRSIAALCSSFPGPIAHPSLIASKEEESTQAACAKRRAQRSHRPERPASESLADHQRCSCCHPHGRTAVSPRARLSSRVMRGKRGQPGQQRLAARLQRQRRGLARRL
eukprot:m.195185 g.195185  ORF g.195185 m.195185 type:complete len:316 (+) comp15457_c1_seq10:60-1007(+)